MIHRELTKREKEILEMIRPTTFQDIVEAIRKEVDNSRYNAKRELRNLHNGIKDEAVNGATDGFVNTANERNIVNDTGSNICEVS